MRPALREYLERRRFVRYGRKDGHAGIPPLTEEQTYPFHLWELKQIAERRIGELHHEWVERDRGLKAEYCALLKEIPAAEEHVTEGKADYERSTLEDAVSADEEPAPPVQSQSNNPSSSEDTSPDEVSAHPDTPTFKARRVHMNPIAYRIAITLILLGEFPLNAIAFRLFGEAEVLTWVMTGSLALVLILCAHGLGMFLSLDRRTPSERTWTYVLIALPTAVIASIGVIRERYLEAFGGTQEGLGALGPVAGTLAFALINVLIYAAAAMLSYLAHDPNALAKREAEQAADERKRELERRRQEAERRAVELREQGAAAEAQRRADEERRRAEDEQRREAPKLALQVAHARLLELHRRLEATRTDRQKTLQATQARAVQMKNYYEGLIAAYCASNVRAREDRQTPEIFRKHPEINSPLLGLLELDWDCYGEYKSVAVDGHLTTE